MMLGASVAKLESWEAGIICRLCWGKRAPFSRWFTDRTAKEAALHLGSFLGLPEGSIVGSSFHTKVQQAWALIETNSLTVPETRNPASYWLGSFLLSPLSLMVDGVFPLWLHWIFPPHIYVLISSS